MKRLFSEENGYETVNNDGKRAIDVIMDVLSPIFDDADMEGVSLVDLNSIIQQVSYSLKARGFVRQKMAHMQSKK